MPPIDLSKRKLIITLRQKGYSFQNIAETLDISKTGAYEFWKKFQNHGIISNLSKQCNPPILNEREKRQLVNISKKKPFLSAKQVLAESEFADRIKLSTAKEILRKGGQNGHIAARKPLHKKTHRTKRMNFCRNILQMTHEELNEIVFTDETTIDLYPKGKIHVRRPKNKRYDSKYTQKSYRAPNCSISLWGYIKSNGQKGFHFYEGSINSLEYQEILTETILDELEDGHILQQDNARPHTSNSTREYFVENNISVLEGWPPQSPELNVIENLWSYLKMGVRKHNIRNKTELKEVVAAEFEKIPAAYVQKLHGSFRKRIAQCLRKKGHALKY